MNDHADLIFVGGRVHTVNATNDIVPALAVGGGRILAAGDDAEIRALAGPGARVVELRGRSLLPGFIDGHCHLTGLGMAAASIDCKAPGMQSIAALQAAVKQRAASQPPGTWIRGRGYDQSRLKEKRHPNRLDWDAVAPDHPVIFTRTCGHISSVNGRALAAAGIDDATPDPAGGRYDRDGGRHLGVAYETAQTPLQVAAMPSADDFRDALLRADTAYIAAGGTSVHDAGGLVGPAFGPAQALADAGRLRIRIYAFATVNSREHPLMGLLGTGVRTGLGNERLRLGAFKVMTDGSSSGPTAATREPYTSDCHDCGILYWSQDDLDDLIGRAHRQGFQCTVHAVGDRAIEQTLNAMARAQRESPRQGLRHRIEHCGICPPDLRTRVREQHPADHAAGLLLGVRRRLHRQLRSSARRHDVPGAQSAGRGRVGGRLLGRTGHPLRPAVRHRAGADPRDDGRPGVRSRRARRSHHRDPHAHDQRCVRLVRGGAQGESRAG